MDEFGAIEEPTSRAFWGTEDLEEDSSLIFTLEWLTEAPSIFKTLVVVAGNIVTPITEKYFTNKAERICTVNSTSEFNVAALYKLNQDLHVLAVASSVDLTAAGMFVDKISDIISKSEKIIAFANDTRSRLLGVDRNTEDPTLWRSLSTTNARKIQMSVVPALKIPNILAGVSAGVVAYAEMMEIPATVYILYVAEDAYDEETAKPMIKLFEKVTNWSLIDTDLTAKTFDNNKLKLYI